MKLQVIMLQKWRFKRVNVNGTGMFQSYDDIQHDMSRFMTFDISDIFHYKWA